MYETHKDDEALVTGTHSGADGAGALSDSTANFKAWGVVPGVAIYNTTQDTDGLVTAVSHTGITDDTNSWDNGDSYEIYKTPTKDGVISRIGVDKSRGWKAQPEELNSRGWRHEDQDIDVDEHGSHIDVFGPNQPESNHG